MAAEDALRHERYAMVESQVVARHIRDDRVIAAMKAVPRHEFVPEDQRAQAYADRALPIGYGQTISQPYMVAVMCELLDVEPGHKVLEIGAGSGYQAALLGHMAAWVDGIEIVPELVTKARKTLAMLGYTNVAIHEGDGSLGYPESSPYDRIVIAAAAPDVPPPLYDQLTTGGKIVAPVGSRHSQQVLIVTKRDGDLDLDRGIGCVFVPLVGEHGWQF